MHSICYREVKRRITSGRYKRWLILKNGEVFMVEPVLFPRIKRVDIREDSYGNRAVKIVFL